MTDRNSINLPVPEARADAPASVVINPAPKSENNMSKSAIFALGVVTGAVGVVVTAAIINEVEAEKADQFGKNF